MPVIVYIFIGIVCWSILVNEIVKATNEMQMVKEEIPILLLLLVVALLFWPIILIYYFMFKST